MNKKFLSLFFVSLFMLTACGGGASKAEKAGMALAETACLSFDSSVAGEEIETLADFAESSATKYGFESSEDMQVYLDSIEGTEAMNEMAVAAREHLEETCGDSLEALGINAADFAENIISPL